MIRIFHPMLVYPPSQSRVIPEQCAYWGISTNGITISTDFFSSGTRLLAKVAYPLATLADGSTLCVTPLVDECALFVLHWDFKLGNPKAISPTHHLLSSAKESSQPRKNLDFPDSWGPESENQIIYSPRSNTLFTWHKNDKHISRYTRVVSMEYLDRAGFHPPQFSTRTALIYSLRPVRSSALQTDFRLTQRSSQKSWHIHSDVISAHLRAEDVAKEKRSGSLNLSPHSTKSIESPSRSSTPPISPTSSASIASTLAILSEMVAKSNFPPRSINAFIDHFYFEEMVESSKDYYGNAEKMCHVMYMCERIGWSTLPLRGALIRTLRLMSSEARLKLLISLWFDYPECSWTEDSVVIQILIARPKPLEKEGFFHALSTFMASKNKQAQEVQEDGNEGREDDSIATQKSLSSSPMTPASPPSPTPSYAQAHRNSFSFDIDRISRLSYVVGLHTSSQDAIAVPSFNTEQRMKYMPQVEWVSLPSSEEESRYLNFSSETSRRSPAPHVSSASPWSSSSSPPSSYPPSLSSSPTSSSLSSSISSLSSPSSLLTCSTDFALGLPGRREWLVVKGWFAYVRWPWFAHLLAAGLNETKTRIIEMPDWMTPNSLLAVIQIIYGPQGASVELDGDEMKTLLRNGQEIGLMNSSGQVHFAFRRLIYKCKTLLLEPVHRTNWVTQLKLSHELNLQEETNQIIDFLASHKELIHPNSQKEIGPELTSIITERLSQMT